MRRIVVEIARGSLRCARFVTRLLVRFGDFIFDGAIELATRTRALNVRVAIVFGSLSLGLYVAPMLFAGLSSDDAHRPYLAAFGRATGVGTWGAFLAEAKDNAQRTGGFFPLASLPVACWLITPSVLAMRSYEVVAIILNAATFGAFVYRLSRSSGLALVALACVAEALQLRLGADAIIGPILTPQLLLEFTLLALLSALSYQRSGSTLALTCTVLAASAAALTDPLGYAVCLCVALFIAVDPLHPQKRRLPSLALASISIAGVGIALAAHLFPARALTEHDTRRSSPISIVATLSERLLMVLPTTYRARGNLVDESPKNSGEDTRFDKLPVPGRLDWLAVACITASVTAGLLCVAEVAGRARLIVAATSLWVVPACAFAVMALGTGPFAFGLYLQTFGIGLLIAVISCGLLGKLKSDVSRVTYISCAALLTILITYGNVRANAYVIARTNTADAARKMLKPALEAGLFSSIPDKAILVPESFPGFEAATDGVRDFRFAIYALLGRTFTTAQRSALSSASAICREQASHCTPRLPTYLVKDIALPHADGSLTALRWAGSVGTTVLSDGGSRFSSFEHVAGRANAIESVANVSGQGVVLAAQEIGQKSLIVTARRLCGPVAANEVFTASLPHVAWGAGFYAPYPAIPFIASNGLPQRKGSHALDRWSFAGRSAHLIVSREDCVPRALEFSARIYTSAPARIDVRYSVNHQTFATDQDGVEITLPIGADVIRPDIELETDAPSAHDLYALSRFSDARNLDIHMVVIEPRVDIVSSQ